MPDKKNSKNPSNTEQNMDGTAERNITGDDMKRYKNAMDNTRSYVSGDKEWSSSSHQFSRDSSETK
ncbi:MAG: hypothetical protein K0S04_2619 [Herbinix sp.]|jgi:hypothetical protein|nr:hypothetical protein [Herbinix sp.]